MNLKLWQWFVKLTPTNKAYVVLGACAVFFTNAWLIDSRATISRLRDVTARQSTEKQELNNKLVQCKEDAARDRDAVRKEQVEEAQRRARIADSMYYALTAAERAVKIALRNEKR